MEDLGCTRSCAYDGVDCAYDRSLGAWSDGVPISPLVIQDSAPIVP